MDDFHHPQLPVMENINESYRNYRYLSRELQKDPEIIKSVIKLAARSEKPNFRRMDIPMEYFNDPDFMLEVVAIDCSFIKYGKLGSNLSFMFKAVTINGFAYKYASNKLKLNHHLIVAAMTEDIGVMKYLSPSLLEIPEVRNIALKSAKGISQLKIVDNQLKELFVKKLCECGHTKLPYYDAMNLPKNKGFVEIFSGLKISKSSPFYDIYNKWVDEKDVHPSLVKYLITKDTTFYEMKEHWAVEDRSLVLLIVKNEDTRKTYRGYMTSKIYPRLCDELKNDYEILYHLTKIGDIPRDERYMELAIKLLLPVVDSGYKLTDDQQSLLFGHFNMLSLDYCSQLDDVYQEVKEVLGTKRSGNKEQGIQILDSFTCCNIVKIKKLLYIKRYFNLAVKKLSTYFKVRIGDWVNFKGHRDYDLKIIY